MIKHDGTLVLVHVTLMKYCLTHYLRKVFRITAEANQINLVIDPVLMAWTIILIQ